MTAMIMQAMDGEEIADSDQLMRVLGQMWFASLVFWIRGWSNGPQVAEDLTAAARLLIRD